MELGPNQRQWVADLRSGEFEQCVFALHEEGAYCALGMVDREWAKGKPGGYRRIEAKVMLNAMEPLMLWNDDDGKTFPEIADLIEKHADELFSEPR